MAHPIHSPARIRTVIREVLNFAPGYGQSENTLRAGVNELVVGEVNLTNLREAVEWNHQKAYLRQKTNEDTDLVEYFITSEGQAKQEVK